MIASVQPSRLSASNSSARRRVAGGMRLRALRRALPTENIVSAYGTAMCKSSRAGQIATGIATVGLAHAAARPTAVAACAPAVAGSYLT